MEVQPRLKATRFAQLDPGELFLFQIDVGPSFGLKIIDPANDGEIFLLPLGPSFSQELQQPRFYVEPAVTVVSFGKDYIFSSQKIQTDGHSRSRGNNFIAQL